MLLPATTPGEWANTHRAAHRARDEASGGDPESWFTRSELLADDAAALRAAHRRFMDDGSGAQSSAT